MISAIYILTVLVWGTTWFAIKLQVGDIPVEISIFYRQFIAALIFLSWCKLRRVDLKLSKKQHLMALLLGVCMFSTHLLFVYQASIFMYSGMVALVFSLVGFFNILYNRLFLKIYPKPRVIVGSILGILGVVTFFWHEVAASTYEDTTLLGLGLALIGTIIFSFGSFFSKLCQGHGMKVIPTTVLALTYGSLAIFVYTLITGVNFVFPKDPIYWSSILYLALFGTVIGFVSFIWLIREIGADRAGYVTIMFPPIALLLSSVAEGYQWNVEDMLGLLLALIGNVLVLKGSKKERSQSQ